MSDEEHLPAADLDFAATPGAPPEGLSWEADAANGDEAFPLPDAAGGDGGVDRPPTREEFERLAAEVRRLAERFAHERA